MKAVVDRLEVPPARVTRIDQEDALYWLKCAGGQAMALSLMNAALLRNVIRSDGVAAGYFLIPQAENGESPVVGEGMHDLAFDEAIEFDQALDDYRRALRSAERSQAAVNATGQSLKSAVDALAYLLVLQGRVIVDFKILGGGEGRGGGVATAERTAKLLREKFDACRELDGGKGEQTA